MTRPTDADGYGLEGAETEPSRPIPPAVGPPGPRITSAGGVVDTERITSRLDRSAGSDVCFCGYSRQTLSIHQPCPECGRRVLEGEPPLPQTSVVWPIIASLFCSPITGPVAAILAVMANEQRTQRNWARAQTYRRWSHWALWATVAQGVAAAAWVIGIVARP